MILDDKTKKKLRKYWQNIQPIILPSVWQERRNIEAKSEAVDRYVKYIPGYIRLEIEQTLALAFLAFYVFLMTFGISFNYETKKHQTEKDKIFQQTLLETKDTTKATLATEKFDETNQIIFDPKTKELWDYIMTPLGLSKDIGLNILLLIDGCFLCLLPTVKLHHRRKIVDKMYAGKWYQLHNINKTDAKIIEHMSEDSRTYFDHAIFSAPFKNNPKKIQDVTSAIIRGHVKSHPEDLQKILNYTNLKIKQPKSR